MARIVATGVALLGLVAGVWAAEDLEPAERTWARTCVENLASKSVRVRVGAEQALAALGPPALPVVLQNVHRLKTDADWEALGRAVAAMKPSGADALESLQPTWPKPAQSRLAGVVAFARDKSAPAPKPAAGAGPAQGGAPVPESPPEVEAEVRSLLDEYRGLHSMSSEDPALRRIVALGRPAFGAVVEVLRETRRGDGMIRSAITTVLEKLGREGDEPLVAELLREGHLEAAAALENVRTEAALTVLVDCIDRGFVSHDVLEALATHRREKRVTSSLVGWLERHGRTGGFLTGSVAEFLGKAHAAEAVPILVALLSACAESDVCMRVAVALADLGEKAGIPALIDVLDGSRAGGFGPQDWARHGAGEALNRIAGTAHYRGSIMPGAAARGNHAEAAKAFREWWDRVKETLQWDPSRRAWVQP